MTKEESNKICFKCGGLCCKVQSIECKKTDVVSIEYYETKDIIRKIDLKDNWLYLASFPCKHLTEESKCAIYNQKRPKICETFPTKTVVPQWELFCELAKILKKERKEKDSMFLVLK